MILQKIYSLKTSIHQLCCFLAKQFQLNEVCCSLTYLLVTLEIVLKMGIFIFLIHNTQTSQKYIYFFCRSPFDKESTLGELKLSVSVLQRLWELGVFDLDAEIAQIASYFVNIERIWPDFFLTPFQVCDLIPISYVQTSQYENQMLFKVRVCDLDQGENWEVHKATSSQNNGNKQGQKQNETCNYKLIFNPDFHITAPFPCQNINSCQSS